MHGYINTVVDIISVQVSLLLRQLYVFTPRLVAIQNRQAYSVVSSTPQKGSVLSSYYCHLLNCTN